MIMSSSLLLLFFSSPFSGKNGPREHSLVSVMLNSMEVKQRAMVRGCQFAFLFDQMLVISTFVIWINSLNFHCHLSKDETNSKSNQITYKGNLNSLFWLSLYILNMGILLPDYHRDYIFELSKQESKNELDTAQIHATFCLVESNVFT